MKIDSKIIYKRLKHSKSAEEAYRLFTTKEGLKKFFGVDNNIEMTPFGKYEIYFLMDSPQGLKGSEGCKVLSFVPDKMLSFTWNAPPLYLKIRASKYKTWVVLNFEDGLIELRHLGWPEDQAWNPVFDYFNKAWSMVLDAFSKLD